MSLRKAENRNNTDVWQTVHEKRTAVSYREPIPQRSFFMPERSFFTAEVQKGTDMGIGAGQAAFGVRRIEIVFRRGYNEFDKKRKGSCFFVNKRIRNGE